MCLKIDANKPNSLFTPSLTYGIRLQKNTTYFEAIWSVSLSFCLFVCMFVCVCVFVCLFVCVWWQDISSAQTEVKLQSGPKVLNHSGVFIRDFPTPHFSMLIHTTLARTPLLSTEYNTETRRGKGEGGRGKGEFDFGTRVWDYDSISQWRKNFILVL